MYSVQELVPHSGKMMLLDKVIDFGEEWLEAEVRIHQNSMFCDGHSVPALVGIEYMAQAIAAFAGKNSKNNKADISIGLLLGTRKYESNTSRFNVGTVLKITVNQVYLEDMGLGVFNVGYSLYI